MRDELSWDGYIEDLEELGKRVSRIGSVAMVYSCGPHGLMIAGYLHFQLGLRVVQGPVVIMEIERSASSILLVDGTCSTGEQFMSFPDSPSAVIYREPCKFSSFKPTVFVEDIPAPIKFPYESR